MEANVNIEKQFLRLIMFCHKISLPVVRTFFVSGVLRCPDYNNDIITFLEHHKHELLHLVGDNKCCQCTSLPALQTGSLKFRLGNDQFKKLYEIGLSQPGHFMKGSGGRVIQQCLCCVTVRKETDPKTYDISLLFAILYNCVQISDNTRLWLDTIRKGRNRLCHLNDINDLSENEIQTLWGNLECSVVRLAEEIHSLPYYKECIEQHVDTFKYTDYNREAITPIIESMRSEINNNINEVIQNQINSQEEIRCLTIHVEQLSQNCKKDTQNMLNHVTESAKTTVDLHQDAIRQVSAQVAKCHIEEVELIKDQNKTVIESSEKVSGTMEHVMDKLNFLVDIAIDNKKLQHTQNDSILPKSANERSTTQQQMNSEEQDKKRCKLHWRIETPGYLEHKKDEIVKAMKNAIEIVKIGTSHEIEDIHEGSITIDTLLPMSILLDKNAFHQSIRKFLEEMVSVCGLDPNIPLSVKVQITLSDLEQGSVKYSIEEMKHTTMIDKAVQAVPTMLDRSTGSSELEIEEELDSTKGPEDDMMIYSASIKDNVLIPPSEMAFLQDEYGDFPTYEDEKYMLLMGCFNDIRWIESVLTFFKRVAPICNLGIKEKSKKLLNSKFINTFIHIASKSSQRSNNLKSMLQCLSESKDLQNNVITVVRDDVIISDLLKESKQIRVKINEKEWLPDLMDAIASSGDILYSVNCPIQRWNNFTTGIMRNTVLIFGNFRDIQLINFFLSEYEMHTEKYKICLQKTFPVLHNIKRLDGIIYLISDDLKEDFCFHPDIIELKKKARKEIALMINHMTLPKLLHGITQIDATDNSEDWIPNLIDEMQIMNDMVYTMRINEKNTYGFPSMSRYNVEACQIVLIGNTKDVQWFFSALSESKMVEPSMVELVMWPHCRLVKERLSGLVCITGVNLERYHNQLVDITTFKSKEIVTITRDETTVPDMLEGTILVDARGTDCKWISDLIDWLHRLMSTVYILRYESIGMHREFNAYDENNDDNDGLILLMGNSEEVQQFYTTLLKSHIGKGSQLILQCVPTGRIHNDTIKSVICIVAKSSKDEDFVSSIQIENLECWPNNVVTLVREQTSVPNILLKTKQIVDTGKDDMWLSDVMDEINRTMPTVYILRFKNVNALYGHPRYESIGMYREFSDYDEDNDDVYDVDGLILLMGNSEEVQQFYTTLLKSQIGKGSQLILQCVPTGRIHNDTIKSVICIVAKSSNIVDFVSSLQIENLECWPNNVVTLVREQTSVPNILLKTKQIVDTGKDDMWLSDVMDEINKTMPTVYILRFKNVNTLYGHPRDESIGMYREFSDYDEDNDDVDGLILLMGNSEEVQQFYTTLLKSQIGKGAQLILQCVPTRRIHNDTIKSVICIVAKSSKDEDFVSSIQIENLECWPNNVVTLVREQTSVPNILMKTKQIVDTGKDDMWLSDVMDEINKTMSMVYAIKISKSRPTIGFRYLYENYRSKLNLIIGCFKDIQWFHSVLSKSTLIQRGPLMHLHSHHITSTTIQGIICIVGKTIPVVRDTIKIPEIMGGTHKIVVDDRDEKWLSEVLRVIERTSVAQRVEIVRPQLYDIKGCKEWKDMVKPSYTTTSYHTENVFSGKWRGKHENKD